MRLDIENVPAYEVKTQRELDNILDCLSRQIDGYYIGPAKDSNTSWLCILIAQQALSMVRSIFSLCEHRRKTEIDIIKRSLAEYLIDIRLLALRNDPTLNARFRNYPRLLLYWYRDRITSEELKKEVPRIEKEYREYVSSMFPEVVTPSIGTERNYSLRGMESTEKKNRLQQLFPDLPSDDCPLSLLTEISGIKFAVEVASNDKLYWREIDNIIKRKYKVHWSGLSLVDRARTTREGIGDEMPSVVLGKAFDITSNKTHTTPYSIVGLDPKTCELSESCYVADTVLMQDEVFCFQAASYTIEAIALALPEYKEEILNRFYNLADLSHKLKKLLMQHGTRDANSTRDE